MIKSKFYFIFQVILIFGSTHAYASSYDPTNDLFFAFGSKCKAKGPINATALNEGAVLKQIVESIRDDATCRGVAGALADIESLNIPNLLRERVAENDVEYMSMQANDLELAIQSEMRLATPDQA